MIYEIIYYDNNFNASKEESDTFSIYEVTDDKRRMRNYYQVYQGETRTFGSQSWYNYKSNGMETELTKADVFIICL